MSKPKNNPRRTSYTGKQGKTPEEMHELFVQWLTSLVQDTRGRAVIRQMVEQHELPVIEDADGRNAENQHDDLAFSA